MIKTFSEQETINLIDALNLIEDCKRPEVTPSLEEGPGSPPTDPKGGGTR